MNKIKFNAWDRKRQIMWSFEELVRDKIMLSPDGAGFVNVKSINHIQYMTHLTPLPYCGTDDRNNHELYAGDIILSLKTGIKYKIIHPKGCFLGISMNTKNDTISFKYFSHCEKVGNIYETKILNNKEIIE